MLDKLLMTNLNPSNYTLSQFLHFLFSLYFPIFQFHLILMAQLVLISHGSLLNYATRQLRGQCKLKWNSCEMKFFQETIIQFRNCDSKVGKFRLAKRIFILKIIGHYFVYRKPIAILISKLTTSLWMAKLLCTFGCLHSQLLVLT